MPIVALVLVLIAVIGGIVYFRDSGRTLSEVSTTTTETVTPTSAPQATTSTNDVPATAQATDTTPIVRTPPETPTAPEAVKTTEASALAETFTVHKPYRTPAKVQESVTVTFTVADGVVTAVSNTYNEGQGENAHQKRFDAAYTTLVVGKKLTDISLSRVGGASLTSGAFNEAVKEAIAQTAS